MEYLLGTLAVLAALAFVAYPLFRRSAATPRSAETAESFAERRAAVYRELLELEFDHRVGKLTDADFRQLADACLARATALVAAEEQTTEALDDRVEREVAAMRAAMQTSRAAADEGVRTA